MQQLLADEETYRKLKAAAQAKYGEQWLDHMADDAKIKPPAPEQGCYVLMKDGFQLQLNMSASRVKFLKKSGGFIPVTDPKGKKTILDASRIKRISSGFIA